jgi:hypothetical protein
MLYQGMNVPLLKVNTIVEYVGGQVANDKESDKESDSVEAEGYSSDCEVLADLEKEEKKHDNDTQTVKKVLQNKDQKMKSKCVT